MASSRWKRFAFFERQSITIPDAVMNDLQISDTTTTTTTAATSNKNIPLDFFITTAALPLHTKPPSSSSSAVTAANAPENASHSAAPNATQERLSTTTPNAVVAMWSSLSACNPTTIEASASSASDSRPIQLPSQGQASHVPLSASPSVPIATTTLLDGLVLGFVSSLNSSRIHCFDMTVRCNPSKVMSSAATEELDGWRGYWTPFTSTVVRQQQPQPQQQQQQKPAANTSTTSGNDVPSASVGAIAACRIPTSKPRAHSPLHVACLSIQNQLVVYEDPHLYLSCRVPIHDTTTSTESMIMYSIPSGHKWNASNDGEACALNIAPGMVAVGTTTGVVLVYAYNHSATTSNQASIGIATKNKQLSRMLRPYLRIPPPPVSEVGVVSVQLSISSIGKKANIFVSYNRATRTTSPTSVNTGTTSTAGVCCYDLPLPPNHMTALSSTSAPPQTLAAPLSRHDLDGRYVSSNNLVDSYVRRQGGRILIVARPDGLYSYSHTERISVAPIDGPKQAICIIPPPTPAELLREVDLDQLGSGYALVASTDEKSGRDVVDIYDSMNKLVAFHLLLSPGHRALLSAGVTTLPTQLPDGSVRGGRSSGAVITSGGALVTFTEKMTEEKISLLVQKHLFPAAIVVAYADPSYVATDITLLYQQHAEHLYRKGDFSGAMDQYIYTIGSLESSHVIFRYLDAPKIPLLVKYLEQLRTRELATTVHNELLRTCYLKLNDVQAADSIAVSASWSINDTSSLESLLSNLANRPRDALATICSLEAHQTAEVLVIHGASLARVLPRETAGVVISLCVGTYTPRNLADASMAETLSAAAATTTAAALDLKKLVNTSDNPKSVVIEPYPVHLFASAFVEHPKILRLLLAHCNRNKCPITPPLRRTLLELTLTEWNQAKRSGDTEAEKLRHKDAIASLTDSHSRDIGDYDALVIVQLAGFEDGELLLYERLQMTPVLLERYAKDGSEKARRQMLAMCQTDPEILADVLGNLVEIARKKLNECVSREVNDATDEETVQDELGEILDDIQEALTLARRQGVLPPVRIARILAGEGSGQFSSDAQNRERKHTIPLSVALDYVGTVLEKSRKEASRLKSEIEEYNHMCNSMENEIASLLRVSLGLTPLSDDETANLHNSRLNIDELFAKVKYDEGSPVTNIISEHSREAFWREMNQSRDSFDTISHFFAKGSIS